MKVKCDMCGKIGEGSQLELLDANWWFLAGKYSRDRCYCYSCMINKFEEISLKLDKEHSEEE